MENYTLFELEKDFYLGNYQSCVNKANSMPAEREPLFYMCLSQFYLKKYDHLELELKNHKSIKCLQLIGLLLNYTRDQSSRNAIIQRLDTMLEDKTVDADDDLSRLVMSSIYSSHKSHVNALKSIHRLDSLPAFLMRIMILIAMNRLDIAERTLKAMQAKDDFATLTLLAVAQVRLATCVPNEAYDIGRELEDKYRATPLLSNLQATAAISMGQYDLAEQHCESALDLDNDNPEALINLLHCLSKLRASSEVKERNFLRLQTTNPNHEFVQDYNKMTAELAQ